MDVLDVNSFPYEIIENIPILKPHSAKKDRTSYLDIITAFDIETTNVCNDQANIMYIWQFQFGLDYTIVGRTWDEYFDFLHRLKKHIRKGCRLVIYDHNLSYEFQYLKGLYFFEKEEVFATDSRKVLKCTMYDAFEYRCSLMLTNCSLAQFTKQYQVENIKLSGAEFDYTKVRYPWTPLTDRELEYCINDVKGLVQALYKKLAVTNDNVMTVPLTQTGYIRRKCRKAMQGYNHEQLQDMLPDPVVYELLREAYRGGNTHANRYYVGDVIENVKSYDIVSSYPAVMLQCNYPMSKFYYCPDATIDEINTMIYEREQAVLMRIAFWNIDLQNVMIGCPYLTRSKCRNIINGVFDNGRVLRAEYLETTITDIDLKIILRMYKWEACNPYDVFTAYYKPLPDMLLDVIRELYTKKTELKGVSDDDENYYIYMLNKEQLNSVYGMTAQDPVKDTIDYIADNPADDIFHMRDEPLEQLLEASNKKAFMSYGWGVWVTAHARERLQEAIDMAEATQSFVYCDTDSVKYVGEIDLSEFNEKRRDECIANKAYAFDNHGEPHFIGQFEYEGLYPKFATLGAKKYCYEDEKGKLHITIAGVMKHEGAQELGDIHNFKEGFVFNKAGGVESHYHDHMDEYITLDGHKVHVTDNVVLTNSEYTLGITQEFRDILSGLIPIKYADHDIPGLYKVKRIGGRKDE